MARMTSGLTTKGPMPIMSIMLRATASFRPRPRTKPGSGVALPGAEVDFVLASGSEAGFCGGVIGPQRIANGRHSSYKIKEEPHFRWLHIVGRIDLTVPRVIIMKG